MRNQYIALALVAPALFVACENPADKTTQATVTEAVEKSAEPVATGTTWAFTPESEIRFIGSKVTGSHLGGFKTFTGHFTVKDGEPVGNDNKVVIDMNSTFVDDAKLQDHLKSEDFFDVTKYPQATFDATALKKESEGKYTISGNFTLRGVTKNISFPATVSQNGDSVKLEAEFNINRKDFGIVYDGKADNLIRDEVVIQLKLTAKPEA